jgi:hypothetical protein
VVDSRGAGGKRGEWSGLARWLRGLDMWCWLESWAGFCEGRMWNEQLHQSALAAIARYYRWGYLKQKKTTSSTVLEAGSRRSRCYQGGFLLMSLLLADGLLTSFSSSSLYRVS